MRGIYNSVTDIRRNVFTEIARLAYEGGDYASSIEKLPFKIIPGERATYRDSIFLERAIVGERLRLGIGLPVRRMDEHSSLSDGIEESAIAEKYYDDPGKRYQVCLQCMSGKDGCGNRYVSGLSGTSMQGGMSKGCDLYGERKILHRSGKMHQMRTLYGCVSIWCNQ